MSASDEAPPFTMAVELGKIREFARATKSTSPEHTGAPGDAPIMPPTFLATSTFWQGPEHSAMKGMGVQSARILHGGQEFTFHGEPPRAGAVLTGRQRVDKVYEKEGKRGGTMRFIELITDYHDDSGQLVAESRSTVIETSKATGA